MKDSFCDKLGYACERVIRQMWLKAWRSYDSKIHPVCEKCGKK